MSQKPIEPDCIDENIEAGQFWNIYFSRSFIELKRTYVGYEGMYPDVSKANPKSFVRFPKFVQFTITKEKLLKYDCDNDPRFTIPKSAPDALISELRAGDMNSMALQTACSILEKWCQLPDQAGLKFQKRIDQLEKYLPKVNFLEKHFTEYFFATKATKTDKEQFEHDGRMDRLHVEKTHFLRALAKTRDPFAREVLLSLATSPWEDEEVAEESILLLGWLNNKDDIPFLISLLDNRELFSRHKAASRALEYICSGATLIRSHTEEMNADFWRNKLIDLPTDTNKWLRYDAESIFWEKRYDVARKFIASPDNLSRHPEVLAILNADEVPVLKLVGFEKGKKDKR